MELSTTKQQLKRAKEELTLLEQNHDYLFKVYTDSMKEDMPKWTDGDEKRMELAMRRQSNFNAWSEAVEKIRKKRELIQELEREEEGVVPIDLDPGDASPKPSRGKVSLPEMRLSIIPAIGTTPEINMVVFYYPENYDDAAYLLYPVQKGKREHNGFVLIDCLSVDFNLLQMIQEMVEISKKQPLDLIVTHYDPDTPGNLKYFYGKPDVKIHINKGRKKLQRENSNITGAKIIEHRLGTRIECIDYERPLCYMVHITGKNTLFMGDLASIDEKWDPLVVKNFKKIDDKNPIKYLFTHQSRWDNVIDGFRERIKKVSILEEEKGDASPEPGRGKASPARREQTPLPLVQPKIGDIQRQLDEANAMLETLNDSYKNRVISPTKFQERQEELLDQIRYLQETLAEMAKLREKKEEQVIPMDIDDGSEEASPETGRGKTSPAPPREKIPPPKENEEEEEEEEEEEDLGGGSSKTGREDASPKPEIEISEHEGGVEGIRMTIFSCVFVQKGSIIDKSAYLLHPDPDPNSTKGKRYILIDCLPDTINLYEEILNYIQQENFPHVLHVCLTDTDDRFGGTGIKHFYDKPNVQIFTRTTYLNDLKCSNKEGKTNGEFIGGIDTTDNTRITCLTHEVKKKSGSYYKMLYYIKKKGIIFIGHIAKDNKSWLQKKDIQEIDFVFDCSRRGKNMVYKYNPGSRNRFMAAQNMTEVYEIVMEYLRDQKQPIKLPSEDNIDEWINFSATHKKIGKILENLDLSVTFEEIEDENTKKKIIFLQNIIAGPKILSVRGGYGLFADRGNTDKTEIRITYGGKLGEVYTENDEKTKQLNGKYVITIANPGNEEESRDIDGQYNFTLSQKGRWINSNKNLLNVIADPIEDVDFDNGTIVFESAFEITKIHKGTELFADYEGDYASDYDFPLFDYKEDNLQYLDNLSNQKSNLENYVEYLSSGGRKNSFILLENQDMVNAFITEITDLKYNEASQTFVFRKGRYFVKILRVNIHEDEAEHTKEDAIREISACIVGNELGGKCSVFAKTLGAFYSDVIPVHKDSRPVPSDFYLYLVMPFYENVVAQMVDSVSTFLELCIAIYYGRREINFHHGDINHNNVLFVMDDNIRIYEIENIEYKFKGIKPVLIDYGRALFGKGTTSTKEELSDLLHATQLWVWFFEKRFQENIAFRKYLQELEYLMIPDILSLFINVEGKTYLEELLMTWEIDEKDQKNLSQDGRFKVGNIKFIIENFPFDHMHEDEISIKNVTIYDPETIDSFVDLINQANDGVYVANKSTLKPGLRGLFAKKDFKKGDFICEYGGFLSAAKPFYDHYNRNYSVELMLFSDTELDLLKQQSQQEQKYKVDIEKTKRDKEEKFEFKSIDDDEEEEKDEEYEKEKQELETLSERTHKKIRFYLDGEYHFKLGQPGRFANGVPWTIENEPFKKEQNNAVMTERYFKVSLYASKQIKKNEEILLEYGTNFDWGDIYNSDDLKRWGWTLKKNKELTMTTKKTLPGDENLKTIRKFAPLDVIEGYVSMINNESDLDVKKDLWERFSWYVLQYAITDVNDKKRACAIVRTVIGPSKLMLNDVDVLCARQPFKSGEVITSMGGMVTRENVFGLSDPAFGAMKFGQWWVFPHMCYYIRDFGNHAKRVYNKNIANCRLERDITTKPDHGYYIQLIARRDIEPEEEITYFYSN
jgi:hypothetical protein